jgi:REP element-mobilizing transposase RayT
MFTNNLRRHGYLPHFIPTGYIHTVRISEFDVVPPPMREASTELPHGQCRLSQTEVAQIVEDSLLFLHQSKIIRLFAYVVMPNHVHILARFNEDLGQTCRRLKTYTNYRVREEVGLTGKFWQRDYFDHFVATEIEFQTAKSYIENNPVRAGLSSSAKDWEFSSAFPGKRLY